jgi:hypothetical protein
MPIALSNPNLKILRRSHRPRIDALDKGRNINRAKVLTLCERPRVDPAKL